MAGVGLYAHPPTPIRHAPPRHACGFRNVLRISDVLSDLSRTGRLGTVSAHRTDPYGLFKHSRDPHGARRRRAPAGDYHAEPRPFRAIRPAPANRALDAAHLALRKRYRSRRVPDALPDALS